MRNSLTSQMRLNTTYASAGTGVLLARRARADTDEVVGRSGDHVSERRAEACEAPSRAGPSVEVVTGTGLQRHIRALGGIQIEPKPFGATKS
jgi:hypothetical protein